MRIDVKCPGCGVEFRNLDVQNMSSNYWCGCTAACSKIIPLQEAIDCYTQHHSPATSPPNQAAPILHNKRCPDCGQEWRGYNRSPTLTTRCASGAACRAYLDAEFIATYILHHQPGPGLIFNPSTMSGVPDPNAPPNVIYMLPSLPTDEELDALELKLKANLFAGKAKKTYPDGVTCMRCNLHNPWGEPNRPNEQYLCFNCTR